MARVLTRWKATIASLATFGGVGAIAFIVDIGVYNLLRATVLEGSPIWSKVASVAVATVVAWIGNRLLTFRATRNGNVVREAALFAVMNVGGLLIAAACLFISHYVLGFTSQLADNISGNGIGLVLGTAFRYLGYRFVVFRPARTGDDGTSEPDPTHPETAEPRTTPRTGGPHRRGVTPFETATPTRSQSLTLPAPFTSETRGIR
ncbi:putative flippase GtrA [Labedella gwakjiensis]|uniref:GtrA family protein n=1 Tax=Labedella gwakjiensis TaxID=390269 RepID=A0A2P8GTF7_9MICO|nr:GtrA family protein [Labedella gwakjiensis]PSL37253.1 putative flippase GtrA [Labedella gwakjiensis]RUQ84583.1 GtrA family protein [Labedella gwakjiensis]